MTVATLRRSVASIAKRVPVAGVPRVVVVPFGVSQDAALRQFAAAHPSIPRGHAILVVPEGPSSAAEHATFAQQYREQQIGVVTAARSERGVASRTERYRESPPTFPPGMVFKAPYRPAVPIKWSPNNVR